MRTMLAGCCLVMALAGCKGGTAETDGESGRVPVIRFLRLQEAQERKYLESLGSLSFFEKADVGSKVEGRIETIFVKEGQYVSAGTALARIEQMPFNLALQNAKTEVEQAKNRVRIATMQLEDAVRNVLKHFSAIERARAEMTEKELFLASAETRLSNTEALYEAGGVAKTAYEQTVTARESAQIALTVAQKNLQTLLIGFQDEDLEALGYRGPFSETQRKKLLIKINTTKEEAAVAAARNELLKAQNDLGQAEILLRETVLRSPLGGIVAMRAIDRGEQVKSDAKLFTIIDVSRMYADLFVSEDDLGRIEKAGSVAVTVNAVGETERQGTISLVNPLVDPRTRSVTIRVLLGNPGGTLKPGMFVRARLQLVRDAHAWLIPADAVLERKEKNGFVFVLKQGTVFKTPVQLGEINGDLIEVWKGLERGALVAVPPQKENENEISILADGARVTPVLPEDVPVGTALPTNRAPATATNTNTKKVVLP